jgi:hypothetical protein
MILINFLLALIARWAIRVLALPLYLSGLILSKDRAKYHKDIAISYDQLGNVLGGPLFNKLLRKKRGKKFGNPDETISHILGRNKATNGLTKLGKLIAKTLNKIEPNHVEKAKS